MVRLGPGRRPPQRRPRARRAVPGEAPGGGAARDVARYRTRAQGALRRYRSATAVSVAVTGLLLLLWGTDTVPAVAGPTGQPAAAAAAAPGGQVPPVGDTSAADSAAADSVAVADSTDSAAAAPGRAVQEATGTIQRIARQGYGILPKVLIALGLLFIAGLLTRLLRLVLRRLLAGWQRADALAAIVSVGVWLVALGVAFSVLVGDVRALVGSIGLAGLALSWALQAPIESFTGWLLNSFRSYYRIGDRILVGDVFGDVHRIDVLTTTVWESGGPDKPVQGAQPTGATVTFPNSEVLRANIVNYTRDFPYVWDELTVAMAPETDLRYAMDVVREVAEREVGESMADAARRYAAMLRAQGLEEEVATHPETYVAPADAWTNLTVRYLVPARQRRKWSTRLLLAISEAMAAPENRTRIVAGLPRQVVEQKGGAEPPGR